MDGTLDVVSGEQVESVTSVNSNSRILGFDPLPFATRVILDLETRNRLTEEESPASEVGMTTNDKFAKFGIIFWGVLVVLHITMVIFALDLILMADGEVVLWKLECDGKQDVEGIQDLGVK